MKINILDSSIFNKIAAGEVVEKPASIVKELVENSIDAKAKNITIEIQNGGIDMIKVIDDGVGMDLEDLARVFLPHATSKIKCVEDLAKIGTLGFRGEALASISAVSDVEIISKQQDSEGGRVTCIDTVISEPIEAGSSYGTTIIVTDLFKNIPVRKKFLRKPKAEEGDITSYVEKLILANPTISIKYIVNGKIIYNSTGNSLREAIYTIYGKQVLDNLVEVRLAYSPELSVYGFVSKPTYSRANRNYQTLICNGRYIQNQQISVAVSNAYQGYMMKGQFPFYVLSLTIPVEDVDVNVHPNKLDVRFVNKQQIFSLFYSVVERALLDNGTMVNNNEFLPNSIKDTTLDFTNEFIKNHDQKEIERIINQKSPLLENKEKNLKVDKETKQKIKNELINKYGKDFEEKYGVCVEDDLELGIKQSAIEDYIELKKQMQNQNNKIETKIKDLKVQTKNQEKTTINQNQTKNDLKTDDGLEKEFLERIKKSKELEKITSEIDLTNDIKKEDIKKNEDEKQVIIPITQKSFTESENILQVETETINEQNVVQGMIEDIINIEPEINIIGSCFDTYLLVECGDLYIIDQHAGHERLLYDELTKAINSKEVVCEQLLIPYDFMVDSTEVDFFEENLGVLEEIGFDIKRVGEKTFAMYCCPMILGGINIKNFIDDLLREMPSLLKLKTSDLVKEKLKSMSCRKAIKAGYKMTKKEIATLLKMTAERDTVLMCPHGRPSVIKVTKGDLEKWFKRAV